MSGRELQEGVKMSGGGRKKRTEKKEDDGDEVEKLLRATEDDILLKLSVDSHMSRGSSSQILDPDLDLRLRALRSNSKPTNPASKSNQNQNPPVISSTNRPDLKPNQAVVVDGKDDDDLFARFAALKSSLPSYNSSTFSSVNNNSNKVLPKSGEDEEEEDEVDKVIRWAMDSARLDPSPTSDADTDGDDDDNSETSHESDDDDDDIGDGKKKGKKRK